MTTFLYYRPIIPGYPVTHTSQHLKIIILSLTCIWKNANILLATGTCSLARNAGISKDFIFFVILEYYLINYVKFSAIYVLTTSLLVSDNRVLVRKIDGE